MAAAASSTFAAAIFVFTVAFLAAHHVVDGRNAVMAGDNSGHVDDLVAKACANASYYYSKKEMTREFCESTLRSDKRSAAAKVPRDLAVIAVDLLQRSAGDAVAKIAGYKKAKDEVVLELDYCLVDYNVLAQTIPLCRAAVQKYKGDGFSDMLELDYFNCADRLMGAAKDCWMDIDALIEYGGMTKDVWGQVKEASHRATLVKAMVEQMIGETDSRDHNN